MAQQIQWGRIIEKMMKDSLFHDSQSLLSQALSLRWKSLYPDNSL